MEEERRRRGGQIHFRCSDFRWPCSCSCSRVSIMRDELHAGGLEFFRKVGPDGRKEEELEKSES